MDHKCSGTVNQQEPEMGDSAGLNIMLTAKSSSVSIIGSEQATLPKHDCV